MAHSPSGEEENGRLHKSSDVSPFSGSRSSWDQPPIPTPRHEPSQPLQTSPPNSYPGSGTSQREIARDPTSPSDIPKETASEYRERPKRPRRAPWTAAGGALAVVRALAAMMTRLVVDVVLPAASIARISWGDFRERMIATPPQLDESKYFLSLERKSKSTDDAHVGQWHGRAEWEDARNDDYTDEDINFTNITKEEQQVKLFQDAAQKAIADVQAGARQTWDIVTDALEDVMNAGKDDNNNNND